MPDSKPIGLILCGGKSSRMKGANKALVEFGGEPLLQRIVSVLEPQTNRLLLNLAEKTEDYDLFQLEHCIDILPDNGPLMGLASAFQMTDAEQDIVLCPCDAPFLPPDLVGNLTDMMKGENADIVCPTYGGELQPTFALWNHRTATRVISAAKDEGVGGLKAIYSEFALATIEWPRAMPNPFFNINEPEELKLALSYLD